LRCRGGEGLTGVALPMAARSGGGGSPVRAIGGVEAGVCMDAEVLRAGVVLTEAETRPEEDQCGPPAVECPVAEEEGGSSLLRSEGGGAPRLGSWRQTLG
jgi:hypothetical protein